MITNIRLYSYIVIIISKTRGRELVASLVEMRICRIVGRNNGTIEKSHTSKEMIVEANSVGEHAEG